MLLREALVHKRGFVIPANLTELKQFELRVPASYRHDGHLKRFGKTHARELYDNGLKIFSDKNFANPTHALKARERFLVKLTAINSQVSSDDCLEEYVWDHAHYVGAQGLTLLYELSRNELPEGKRFLSFDNKDHLPFAWGIRRVPVLSLDSGGDSHFESGDFDGPWYNGILVLFCDLPTTPAVGDS